MVFEKLGSIWSALKHDRRIPKVERCPRTNATAEEQLALLQIDDATNFEGKHVLVLGPGVELLLEKHLASKGAHVVAVANSFARSERALKEAKRTHPMLSTITADFKEYRPEPESFDYIFSSWAFPMHAWGGHNDDYFEDEMLHVFAPIVEALRIGGEARFAPMFGSEMDAVAAALAKRYGGAVTAQRFRDSDEAFVIRKNARTHFG